jgi:hypothetical protein
MNTEPTPTLAAVAPATNCSACSEIPVSGTTETQARQIKGNSYRVYHGGEGRPFTDHKSLVMARASACGHDHAVIHHLRPFSQPNAMAVTVADPNPNASNEDGK